MSHGDVIHWRDPSEPAPEVETGARLLVEYKSRSGPGVSWGLMMPSGPWWRDVDATEPTSSNYIVPGHAMSNRGSHAWGVTGWAHLVPVSKPAASPEDQLLAELQAACERYGRRAAIAVLDGDKVRLFGDERLCRALALKDAGADS